MRSLIYYIVSFLLALQSNALIAQSCNVNVGGPPPRLFDFMGGGANNCEAAGAYSLSDADYDLQVNQDHQATINEDLTITNGALNITLVGANSMVIIPAGVTVTVSSLNFSGSATGKQLVVEGTLIVEGTIDFGGNPLEIDGSGSIDAGEITGGDNVSCEDTGTCPGITTDTCDDPGGLCTETSVTPVELLYFEAFTENDQVNLSWATAIEENFDYFSLERSLDGISFYEIAQIYGEGNSYERADYNYTDQFPLVGKSYYRLQSIDFDGYTEIFDHVVVNVDNAQYHASFYPNPVSNGIINIQLNFIAETKGHFLVYDNQGYIQYRGQIDDWNTSFNLGKMQPGSYLVKVLTDKATIIERIMIQ